MSDEVIFKRTRWGKYTVVVAEMDGGKWHATIFRPKSQEEEIEFWLTSGKGVHELTGILKSFGAPEHIKWLPGKGE
jgi:hypothetical protein